MASWYRAIRKGGMQMGNVHAEVAIYPLGTHSTSIGDYVEASDELLKHYPEVQCQVNAMSTVMEGELKQILHIIEQMHEAPFREGGQRVVTSIRIDDRRDTEMPSERTARAGREKPRYEEVGHAQ
jgi:uncharacterized protein (TIGR00106 family)